MSEIDAYTTFLSTTDKYTAKDVRWTRGGIFTAPLILYRTGGRMIQGNLRTQTNSELVELHTTQTESVRIQFFRCRTPATVKWNVVPTELSIVLARNGTGDIRVTADGSSENRAKPGRAGIWFFPEGTDREGELTADSGYDCAGVFIKPSFLPPTTKQALTVPLVGVCSNPLANAFITLAGELARPDNVLPLFAEGWAMQALAHVARATQGQRPTRRAYGGLAPRQLRRAKEMLRADLASRVSLPRVAEACRLSVGYFSQAFKASTGISPHQWVVALRLEAAQNLVENSQVPLVEIACMCGFADQSHLSRVFVHALGASPGAWRRKYSR
jgi:AraC family transcriptional regulator